MIRLDLPLPHRRNGLAACLLTLSTLLLTSCGGEDGPRGSDVQLVREVLAQGAGGDPAQGRTAVTPAGNPLLKLGELLFFSKTLGGTFDAACASCHQPGLAGADALSLAIGVAAVDPDVTGPGRLMKESADYDPDKDGGPNSPRNSQTIINSTLYRKSVFFDGRVATRNLSGNADDGIVTPDSPLSGDPEAGDSLLAAQARFPTTSPDEMRNFLHPQLTGTEDFRNLLVARLRGRADNDHLRPDGPGNWLRLFREAFGQPQADADTIITYANIQAAIAAYEASLVFVDTPWRRFMDGDAHAISNDAKQGALLFFRRREDGGLGCSACHSGSFFTNEAFYNAGFPQLGRGKRADKRDYGRWQVTKQDADKFAFRVPSLINVALTAPYGHAGEFQDLASLLRYHADPVAGAAHYDYSLQQLDQFKYGRTRYPLAPRYTQEAVDSPNLAAGLLPGRPLSAEEVTQLTAFLDTLTDRCLRASVANCLAAWVPDRREDPDGNQIPGSDGAMATRAGPVQAAGAGQATLRPAAIVATAPPPYPASRVNLGTARDARRRTFPDTRPACAGVPASGHLANDGDFFSEEHRALGLRIHHGYDQQRAWFHGKGVNNFSETSFAGGVTAAYLDDDCWPDIAYASGSRRGIVAYVNQRSTGRGFAALDIMPSRAAIGGRYTGIGVADLQGDYHRELVLGNLVAGKVRILKADDSGTYREIAGYDDAKTREVVNGLPMARSTFGIAFGDYNRDGYPDLYFGHWDYGGLPGTAPAFWLNRGGKALSPYDDVVKVSAADALNQNWQFTPAFADVDGDGWQDLLIASDFLTTTVLRNVPNPDPASRDKTTRVFRNVTDVSVITDENGMGSTQGDFTNSGRLDWFVTDIYYPPQTPLLYAGIHGNHLYRNLSTPGKIRFADVSKAAGISNAMWAWGTCAADFNNDGWLDLFVVNGFGVWPHFSGLTDKESTFLAQMGLSPLFQNTAPRLFINNGDGTFTEKAAAWHVDMPLNGRGLACFDYDRDGDIDVAALDQSVGIKFFENHSGSGQGHHFINIRLVGDRPNTDALGARVFVTADLNGNGVIETGETQMRVSRANSNFNSQDLPDLHFGLRDATVVKDIRVVWPDGRARSYRDVAANNFLILRESP
jgi:cytochrome c peroxidase